ncbi:MAG: type II toxin-antitoxin system mRNA interferase toxin, RelE/StbE family [Candidatus Saccharimonadales bacterium]
MTARFEVRYATSFVKLIAKQPVAIQRQARDRINDFRYGINLERLRDHALQGKYKGYRSINISGDVRALYYQQADGTVVIFAVIGTYSQLYG